MRPLQIFVVLFSVFISLSSWARCDEKLRAIIDVGSGTTKMTVARVKVCPDQKLQVVAWLEEGPSRPLALEAAKNEQKKIPKKMQEQLVQTLEKMKSEAKKLSTKYQFPLEITMVATHALRTASNQDQIKNSLKKLGLPFKILSQEEEARIGRQGVPASICGQDKMWVWDIGGGSLQISSEKQFFGFQVGSEKFKKQLIKEWTLPKSGACVPDSETSPNPIGFERFGVVRSWSQLQAREMMQAQGLKGISGCVVGIGGIHNKAIYKNIKSLWPNIKSCVCLESKKNCEFKENYYSREALACLAKRFSTKNDCDSEIKGPYSTTSASNLFLVLGWMEALSLKEVQVADIHMGHALVKETHLKFQQLQ